MHTRIALPSHAAFVLSRLNGAGHAAYLVGGSVRDSLLGRIPGDWDVATDALPAETIAALDGVRVLETGLRHGTVTALTDGGAVEITTFRIDGAYSDTRRPDSVRFTRTLADDLARRDFTINALAYSHATGLIDLHGGVNDLAQKRIRCVGTPARRFTEDALRILRGLRFAATLGFSIEAETAAALREHRALLGALSAERLYAELTRLLCGAWADEVLAAYHDVFLEIVPALSPPGGLLARTAPLLPLRMALFLRGFSPSEADAALVRLRAPNAIRRAVLLLLRELEIPLAADTPALRRLLNRVGEPLLPLLLALKEALGEDISAVSAACTREQESGGCRTLAALAVNGADAAALGFTGREIGAALSALLDAVIDERVVNERESALRALQAMRDSGVAVPD